MDTTCLDVRRDLTTDPHTRDPDILQHLSHCNSCADYQKEVKLFDNKLSAALKIEVPEGLESRILLSQRMSLADADNVHTLKPRTTTSNTFRWMSIAAGVVIAIGLTIGTYKLGESHGIAKEVLAHVYEDIHVLDRDDSIKLATLNKLLEPHGIQANEDIGQIRYASNCPIDNKFAPHFIIDSEGNAITVMYIPWETVRKRSKVKDKRFKGVLIGADQGSFVILTEDQDTLNGMEERVMNSIETRI